MFNSTNYANWVSQMAPLIKPKQVYGILTGYNVKPEQLAANMKATEQSTFKDWMNCHGVARLMILDGMESRINTDCMILDMGKMHWEALKLT
jgi:hypothetical protein